MTDATAIVYARVSSLKKDEDDLPIETQIERCELKASQKGARVLRVFRDDGVSGRAEHRSAFDAAIEFACTQGVDYFITWTSARFARNKLRAAMAKVELEKSGVTLVYCTMDIDTSTDEGWLIDGVYELFDELMSRNVAKDTRRSMERNARQGYFTGGTVPYGFESVSAEDNPKRRRLQPHPTEAPLARRIFELALEIGAVSIAARLNDEGCRYRNGQRWKKQGVMGVLHSRAAIGQVVFNRKDRRTGRIRPPEQWIVVDSHEALITRELWDRVHERMSAGAPAAGHGSAKSTHVFTGLLRCGECGARLQAESAKGRSRRYWYYNCRAATVERAHRPRRLPADDLDAWLIDLICDEILTRDNLEEVIQELRACVADWERHRSERRHERIVELRSIEGKVGKLYDVLELHGKNAPNLGDLTQRLRDHKARQQVLEREIAAIDAEQPPEISVSDDEVRVLAESLTSVLHEATPQRARAFFRDFIDKIVIEDEQVRIEYRPERLVAVPSKEYWLPGTDIQGTATKVVTFPLGRRFRRAA